MNADLTQSRFVDVSIGGLCISDGYSILRTFVGSCVAVCLFDEEQKIAGMAHVMLPKNNTNKSTRGTAYEGKFADDAINSMIDQIQSLCIKPKIQAKIIGGAKIFFSENSDAKWTIGSQNIITIQEILNEKNIPLIAKSVGLNYGRWVTLSCDTGQVTVNGKGEKRIL